jgi:hypothetical protein
VSISTANCLHIPTVQSFDFLWCCRRFGLVFPITLKKITDITNQ